MIRIAGRRSFGQKTPFDACTTVLLRAILSRAVVGASPFWSAVGATMALVVMHRAVGLADFGGLRSTAWSVATNVSSFKVACVIPPPCGKG